jgi:phospholipase C
MAVDRRTFVKGALGASGALLFGVAGATGAATGAAGAAGAANRVGALRRSAAGALPEPGKSGIEHVIVVMMENRSFDHFLGWLPHADGKQAGLSYADPQGTLQATFHQTQFNGCGFTDPDHSYSGGRLQYNGGKMDGFLTDTANDQFAVGYYTAKDRPFMSRLAQAYTTCDRYFCSILAPTYPNRFFQHAAQTDRLDDGLTKATIPTIWDQLNHTGGPTGRYYYSDVPFVALWGGTYSSISFPFSEFLSDAANGTLPNVSYVDPKFAGEADGTSADDHPLADIRAGDAFLSQVFHAVASGPGWDKTVLVINYDEWGGFFEHVVPRRITAGVTVGAAPSSGVDTDLTSAGKVLSGFRVPCIVVSPFSRIGAKHAAVSHNFYDHTSVLKLIEWRWGLEPLTQRDASHEPTDPGNLATLLNFSRPVTKVPTLPVLPPFTPTACAASTTPTTEPPGIAPADFDPGAGPATGPVAADPSANSAQTQATAHYDSWTALARSPLMDGWPTSPLEV